MTKIKVGVIRGGPSSEYDVSLKTGASVLKNLPEEKYDARDIFISKDGEWHLRGAPIEPSKAIQQFDVIFNALHGEYGEDGTVQRLLDTFSVLYTGSESFSSAMAMNKLLTKQKLEQEGIKTAKHIVLNLSDIEDIGRIAFDIFRSFSQPSVIKPVVGGSSVGVSIARSYDDLVFGIGKAFECSPRIMIEEYIKGREATCGVVEGFRGEDLHSLFPIEIIPQSNNNFFDYNAKYNGNTLEICPADFSHEEKNELQEIAKSVHEILGLRHYSRSDFIVSPRGIYFLEVNTLPGLTEESLVPKALVAAGSSLPEFLDHIVELALDNN